MARARNIKHSFFINEDVADNDPLGRLLFIGLWTLADYKGELEWKERTIKVQLLPFDDCDVKKLAINLDKSGLITFYSDHEKIYVHIPNFSKHQNPHPNEKKKGSDIPPFTEKMRQVIDLKELTINCDLSRQESDDSITDPADSLILNPDSRKMIPEKKGRFTPPTLDDIKNYILEHDLFTVDADSFLNFYESKDWMVGKNKMKDWKSALRGWHSRNGGASASRGDGDVQSTVARMTDTSWADDLETAPARITHS